MPPAPKRPTSSPFGKAKDPPTKSSAPTPRSSRQSPVQGRLPLAQPAMLVQPEQVPRVTFGPLEEMDALPRRLQHVRHLRTHDELNERRNVKLLAAQGRISFLSLNIEEFGYYRLLELFENGSHGALMWPDGKAAKHARSAARDSSGLEGSRRPWRRTVPTTIEGSPAPSTRHRQRRLCVDPRATLADAAH
ncbi:hypothetical protein ON010_g14338 [Phytophthora cinnamomi]|nr:hypothetical protein ON010_g14338 [Phytophthora cinnamomi]